MQVTNRSEGHPVEAVRTGEFPGSLILGLKTASF